MTNSEDKNPWVDLVSSDFNYAKDILCGAGGIQINPPLDEAATKQFCQKICDAIVEYSRSFENVDLWKRND